MGTAEKQVRGTRVPPLRSGRRAALVVATSQYTDPELQQLRAPVADAARFADVLRRPDIADFEVERVIDQPSQVIAKRLHQFLSDRARDDLLVVYFSCHGLKDLDGSLYFAGTNTEMRYLASTGVSAEYVNQRVSACRSSRIVILLDCCYSGAFTKLGVKGDTSVAVEERLQGQGRVVMTASNSMEYAFEGEHVSMRSPAPSLFTGTVVRGLTTGEADRDRDGRISVDELYEYVFAEVRKVTPHQTPGLFASLSGTLYLARRPDVDVDLEPRAPIPQQRPSPPRAPTVPRRSPSRRRLAARVTAAVCAMFLAATIALVLLLRDGAPTAGETWSQISDMPQPLEAAAVTSYRDRVFVIGGVDPSQGRGPLDTVQVYDPAVSRWSIGPSLPVALNHAAAVSTLNAIYVIGGLAADGSSAAVYRLDSPDGQWQEDRALPEPRGAGAAAFDGERIVFGGGVARDGSARADIWAMRPGELWLPVGELQPAREKLAATTDGYGRVWFLGGRDIRAGPGERTYGSVDLVTKTEVQHLGEAIPPLSATAGVQFPGQGMCILGGQTPDGQFSASVHASTAVKNRSHRSYLVRGPASARQYCAARSTRSAVTTPASTEQPWLRSTAPSNDDATHAARVRGGRRRTPPARNRRRQG